MTDIEQLEKRVGQLETVLRALYPEVQHLRAAVETLRARFTDMPDPQSQRGAPPDAPPDAPPLAPLVAPALVPAMPPPVSTVLSPTADAVEGTGREPPRPESPHAAPARSDVESLIGRYGTLGLATLMILLAVGAFVRWAIAQGLLGPAARVGLGVVAAGLVAGIGLWLRGRGARQFGYTLLSLALAILHVDAWGAGPVLHLVSAGVALGAAALASVALAALALADDEESIFCVGVGGALLAPFVTAANATNGLALLAFGYAVIASATTAVRGRRWGFSVALLGAAVIVYTWGALVAQGSGTSEPGALVPVAFALACAITGLMALSASRRASMVQASLAAAWVALVTLAGQRGPAEQVIAGAMLATAIAYATIPRLGEAPIQVLVGAGVLPAAFLFAAFDVLPHSTAAHAALVAVWGLFAAAAGVTFDALARPTEPPRVPWAERTGAMWAAVSAVGEGGVAIILGLKDRDPAVGVIALSAYATIVALIGIQRAWRTALTTASITLGVAVAWSWFLLAGRPGFVHLPFLTPASAAAAIAAICTVVIGESVTRAPQLWNGAEAATVRARARLLEGVAAFWWLRLELAHVGSPAVSTSLLVAYYAVTGVGAVLVGRERRIPPLRHAGLALAVYAALKAMLEASQLSTGLRIASYLSAGIFLLTVAYWYRNSTDQSARDVMHPE